jgi:hypothetical protein
MARKKISSLECDWYSQQERFVTLRIAERRSFPSGKEVQIEFTGRDAFEGFAMARLAAMAYAGMITPGWRADTIPFVSELGPYSGRVVGRQTSDTNQGWRIDLTKDTKEFHVNWWDRRRDTSGKLDKSKHFYGANFVTNGTQQLFWEIESHFPGAVG